MKLTIQIIGKENLIQKTLKNVENIGCTVLVHESKQDRSILRNLLLDKSCTDWNFWLEAGETVENSEVLHWVVEQETPCFRCYYPSGSIINKVTRLWRKSCGQIFCRPVYEGLTPEINGPIVDLVIRNENIDSTDNLQLLLEWKKKQPHAADIDYYLGCCYGSNKNYEMSIKHLEEFLFKSINTSPAWTMSHYYLARLYNKYRQDKKKCLDHLMNILPWHPTLAELWCELGDLFFSLQQKQRAEAFYENAITLGKKRLHEDPYPIDIDCYEFYPKKQIIKCNQVH